MALNGDIVFVDNLDGSTIVNTGGVISAVAEDAAGTDFDPATSTLTSTDVQGAIEELETLLSGVAHTTITDVDLQPTANPNEFTVVITWTDGDGNAQTTTDPTPITIASQTVVSADAGNVLTAGTDQGALLTEQDLCDVVENTCTVGCDITDAAGVVRGTVLELAP